MKAKGADQCRRKRRSKKRIKKNKKIVINKKDQFQIVLRCLIGIYGIYKSMRKERRTKISRNLRRIKAVQEREVDRKRR